MARELRVVAFVNGDQVRDLPFANFRAARDWANAAVGAYADEPDFYLSVQQRRSDNWEEMLAYGPAAPVQMPKRVHLYCSLCYSHFTASEMSLRGGYALCPHCGASSVVEEH
jgi:hypothetical protein